MTNFDMEDLSWILAMSAVELEYLELGHPLDDHKYTDELIKRLKSEDYDDLLTLKFSKIGLMFMQFLINDLKFYDGDELNEENYFLILLKELRLFMNDLINVYNKDHKARFTIREIIRFLNKYSRSLAIEERRIACH